MAGNDTRGWILASISGVACIFGSCIICVDYLVRLFPGKEKFEIRRSDAFLSSSLSLSFGVMLFSAMYSMLPESKNSLIEGGMSKRAASYTLIACFLGGVIGIQLISRVVHHFIPSHVVDCEHTHEETDDEEHGDHHTHVHEHGQHGRTESGHDQMHSHNHGHDRMRRSKTLNGNLKKVSAETNALLGPRRPGAPLRSRVSGILKGSKAACDEQGPCHGFSDPCSRECFMNNVPNQTTSSPLLPPGSRSVSGPIRTVSASMDTLHESTQTTDYTHLQREGSEHCGNADSNSSSTAAGPRSESPDLEQNPQEAHHHHVPDNAFLSIGLQTSLAIALHKLPEGFITYATNHANPQLGTSIFVALFIHNITEGFALALPLFLAINSRWKAILIASILGGASQPLGAAIAELWFRAANQRGMKPDAKVYGCMFAITAGIMTSVALQLFSESLARTHNRTLCLVWAFVGMGILGLSSALTA